jgi:hypothetical protein
MELDEDEVRMIQMCACGQPLHYTDAKHYALVQEMVEAFGETVIVTVNGHGYRVPRHYIALHGLEGWHLEEIAKEMGFEEVERQV